MADVVEQVPSADGHIDEKKHDTFVTEKGDVHNSDSDLHLEDVEVAPGFVESKDFEGHYKDVPLGEGIVPEDSDFFIDPRLKDYPIPLVAKTVDLKNDPT